MRRLAAVLAIVLVGCQMRPGSSGEGGGGHSGGDAVATRIDRGDDGLLTITGAEFAGYALVPSDTASPPEWELDVASVDRFESGLGDALAAAVAGGDKRVQVSPEFAGNVGAYTRRYHGYLDRAGGKRMYVDFFCAEGAANASRSRTAPLVLQNLETPRCFARAIYDVDNGILQQMVVR